MQTRPATTQEVLDHIKYALATDAKVSYRGFIRERAMRTARNGVQHIQHFKGKVFVAVDGEPCVKTPKGSEKLTATVILAEGELTRNVVCDLRIKSEYLK